MRNLSDWVWNGKTQIANSFLVGYLLFVVSKWIPVDPGFAGLLVIASAILIVRSFFVYEGNNDQR